MSCIMNFLPVNFGKCMTMSQPPGLLPAFINFKWRTQILDVEVVWCEVLSHHPFCTMADSTGQKKRLYFFGHINLIMVSDSDGFIVVCFEIQILIALHTWPNDKRHKLIQQLGPVTKAWKKKKEINRESMDVGWLGGGKMLKLWSKSWVLNAIHLTEWFPRPF